MGMYFLIGGTPTNGFWSMVSLYIHTQMVFGSPPIHRTPPHVIAQMYTNVTSRHRPISLLSDSQHAGAFLSVARQQA